MAVKSVKRGFLTALAVMVTIAFGTFGQKAFGDEPNAPAEKKGTKNHMVEHRMGGERVRQRMAELSEKLNLTEEQKKSIRPIVANEVRDLEAVRGDATLSKEQKMEKATAIRQASRDEINKVLTPEQQAKLAEMKTEAKEEMKEGMKGDMVGRAQRRMMELNAKLNLTDEQKKSIQPIIENEMKEAAALRGDTTLTKEQRLEKMKVIHQTAQDDIKKVLTAEQQAKFDAMTEKPRERKPEQKGGEQKQ